MTEESDKSKQFWDHEIPDEWRDFKYAIGHSLTHSKREILVQFYNPRPIEKPISVARLILSPEHAHELILNLQKQLQRLKADRGGLPPDRS